MESKPCNWAEQTRRRFSQWHEQPWPEDSWPLLAAELADQLLRASLKEKTNEEDRQHAQLSRLLLDSNGKAFTSALTDRVYRSRQPRRIVTQVTRLIEQYGIPNYFGGFEKLQLRAFQHVGPLFPQSAVPAMLAKLRSETETVILSGEEDKLVRHLGQRKSEGVRVNCNRLGEAILGEEEALARLEVYLNDLRNPNIDYISVKISSICSNINLLAWDHSYERLATRLRELYRTAIANPITIEGKPRAKFVNLDMEEYRDLELTLAIFCGVLSESEFHQYSAGIVLQAYLPDSWPLQQQLTTWAIDRFESGGAPIRLRIVKGANLAMEQIDASLHGWRQAPYESKADVDANFKRMVHYGCHPRFARAVNLGIASHNLFDIAYAMILRVANSVESSVGFEMLEGMAEHQRRAIQQITDDVLLYSPLADEDDFRSAIAYLIRRLEENTNEGNFLRHIFDLQPESTVWSEQKRLFLQACSQQESVEFGPRRDQDQRNTDSKPISPQETFRNEADTDFVLRRHREWVFDHIEAELQANRIHVPVQVAGRELSENLERGDGFDPSRPSTVAYTYSFADEAAIDRALSSAQESLRHWSRQPLRYRSEVLGRCAHSIRQARGKLISTMMMDAGKAIREADTEISEAIDFAEYYRRSLDSLVETNAFELSPLGVVVITPPWNFPFAIPAGGIFAALMAGNTVILKPSTETILCAWHLVNLLWESGVPKDVLQFVPCREDPVGTKLIRDPRVNSVILTGATSTAQLFAGWRPDMALFAETGGKNVIIVSAVADIDLAIRDIAHSAFGHSGQKCSATSLVICEPEIYHDPQFCNRLRDAVASLPVGSAWEPENIVTPMIHPPRGPLERALHSLEEGESWLLEPKADPNNPRIWSPGIKKDVQPNSFFQQTECFGPVLGMICAQDLPHAIQIANSTDYGLTSGLHSLDEQEQKYWTENIEAGNLYINRTTTGAIVQRQPFGGWKRSNFGPGAKAGGPNYVYQLTHLHEKHGPAHTGSARSPELQTWIMSVSSLLGDQADLFRRSVLNYEHLWHEHFSLHHDPSQIRGQENIFRYRPLRVLIRIGESAELADFARVLAALQICSTPGQISLDTRMPESFQSLASKHCQIPVYRESESDATKRLPNFDRIRSLGRCSPQFLEDIRRENLFCSSAPVYSHGRIELINYLREQSLSIDTHRYGNLSPSSLWNKCSVADLRSQPSE